VAGDAAGIEEASTALLEGRIAGAAASAKIACAEKDACALIAEAQKMLTQLRATAFAERVRAGLRKVLLPRAAA
jgi:sarcosine oxidase subunit alpha